MKKIGRTLAVCMTASVLAVSAAVSASAATFSDVSGHWAEATINQWVNYGYINGYPDGTFRPREPISRTEFAVVANHAFNFQNKQAIYFPDVAQTFWGYAEIQKAFAAGYMSGDAGGTFRPKAYVTRQEAAIMLANIKGLGFSGTAPYYSDSAQISSWARNSVNAVTAAGYMSGYPDGSFRPKAQISRAEVVTMLNKALTTGGSTYVPPVQQPSTSTGSVQNMTLSDTTLRNTVVNGNLTIPSSMSSRSITLDNVTVRGTLIVEGGGTITADDCDINELRMSKSSAVFRSEGTTGVARTTFRANGTLEGDGYAEVNIANSGVSTATIDAEVDTLTLDTDADVRLYSNADIDTFEITKNADDALIELSKSARVRNMNIRDEVRIAGSGRIDNMTVYVSGVRSEIEPDSLSRKSGAGKPDFDYEYTGTRHEGGSSSSSSSSSSSTKTISKDFDGNGARYRNVTITDDADVEDMRVTNNLTISADVGNGTVRLEDVEVDGNVYVYGGGDSSVDFIDCDIHGDIISNKNSSRSNSEVVALKFDSGTTVDGEVRILNHTILEDYSGSPELDHVVVETRGAELEIGINIDTLEMDARGTLDVKSGVTIGTLKTNRSIGTTTVDMSGSSRIRNIDARSDVQINGTGTVNTVNKDSGIDVSMGNNITHDPSGSTGSASVTGVSISPATASVAVGRTLQLTAVISPDDARDKTVAWKSSDTSIAKVSEAGVVTGVKEGKATITVTTNDGVKTATREVTVVPAGTVVDPDTPVTQMMIDPAVVSLQEGATMTLRLRFPEGDSINGKTVDWNVTAGSDVVSLTGDDAGNRLLKAEKEGTAVVTASVRMENGTTETLTCDVTVTKRTTGGAVALNSVEIAQGGKAVDAVSVKVGTETTQLEALLNPPNATYEFIGWSSSDTDVVEPNKTSSDSITKTYLNAKRVGTATITLTVRGADKIEHEDTCTVYVSETGESNIPVSGVELDEKGSITLLKGSTKKLTATVKPNTAGNQKVSWTSSNPQFATVSDTGLVTAVAEGRTAITVKTEEGNFTASCTVDVVDELVAATGVTLDKTVLTIKAGDDTTLTATVEPEGATDKTVKWNSSNTSIARVDGNGKVTAVAPGTATITATPADNGTPATCEVTVEPAVTINEKDFEMSQSATKNISLTANPHISTANGSRLEIDISKGADVVEAGTVPAGHPGTGDAITIETFADTPVGTYTLEVTVTCNGQTASDSTTFRVTAAGTGDTSVNSITITSSPQEVTVGDTVNATATTDPAGAAVTWASSDDEVAMVTQGGAITGVNSGEAIITATAGDESANFSIKVHPKVTVTEPANLTVEAGNPIIFRYEIVGGVNPQVTATVKDASGAVMNGWATVQNENKTVTINVPGTGVTAGTYTMVFDVRDGTNGNVVEKEFTVTVTPPADTATITLDKSEMTFYLQKLDDKVVTPSQTITAMLSGFEDATTVEWDLTQCDALVMESSSDTGGHTATFKLNENKFTGWGGGSDYSITAKAGGQTATCNVEVKVEKVTGIQLSQTELKLKAGETVTLTATALPKEKACDLSMQWHSNNDKQDRIKIDSSGSSNQCTITAVGETYDEFAEVSVALKDPTNGTFSEWVVCKVAVEAADNAGGGTGDENADAPAASTMSLRQDTATQAAQPQASAPRSFSFIPQRALQGTPAAPSVTVEPEQKEEPVQKTEPVKEPEPEKAKEPEPEKEPEEVKEPEPVQTPEPEQKNGIALTCADSFKADETLTLSGTVNGSTSALRRIEWSIQNDGGTGAKIRDGVLSAETAGTVKIAATVQNSGTTEYFTITVLPGAEPATQEPQEPEQQEPETQEPETTPEPPAQTEPDAVVEGGQPEAAPGVQEPATGETPAVVPSVTLPDGRVVTNVKKLQRSIGVGIALGSLDALPEGVAANSVEWQLVSVGNTGVSIKDNFLVNVNNAGVVLLSRTVHTTDAAGNVSSAVMYYEITIV